LVSLVIAALVAAWNGRGPLVRTPSAPAPAAQRGPGAATRTEVTGLADPGRRAQVDAVIESMTRTGRPPAGVAQGGRRGGARGVFENAEGRLPGQPRGYYQESDVWPRGPDGRGAERLVFGRRGEVWYSGDHYRSFERIR
jgi:guanyl-specific ribonuclease Sa